MGRRTRWLLRAMLAKAKDLEDEKLMYPRFHLKLYAPKKFVPAIQDPHTNIKSKWGPH